MITRLATPADAAAIARIYNQGIEDRVATFETELRTADQICAWFEHLPPLVVIDPSGQVAGFGVLHPYSSRACYRGVAEASVYIAREARGCGAGRLVLEALLKQAGHAGLWKLIASIFVENTASRRLVRSAGFREVGILETQARLDGRWRDCVLVERLIPANLTSD